MPPDEEVQPTEETVEGGPMYYPPEDPGYMQATGTALGTAGVIVTAVAASSDGAGADALLGTGLPESVAAGLSWSLAFLSSGSGLLWFGIFLSAVGVGLNWLSLYVRYKKPRWSFLIRTPARA